MMHFVYTGKDVLGANVHGKIKATNREAVQEFLSKNNITPIEIDIDDQSPSLIDRLNVFNNPTTIDLLIFSRQMYALLKAGVPIIRSINIVSDSCQNPKLKTTLSNIAARLEAGYALAVSISKYHKFFPRLMGPLINMGEQTGTLDDTFRQIGIYLEKERDTKKRVKIATRYPILVLTAITIAFVIVNVFVVPAFARFFASFHVTLPLPTRILIATSNFFVHYWWLLLAVIIGSIFAWISYISTVPGRLAYDRYKIHLPLIGSIIERSLLSRFTRSFALCFKSGMPLLEAIQIIATTSDNTFMEKKIIEMKVSIEHGESMTIAAKNTSLFTSLVLQMILIGEESGELDRLLDEVSNFYEQELDYDLKQLSSLIEPILIAVMAGIVLLLALGIYLPMWDLVKVAAPH
ncbi:MAG: type II secretion system F family protein [Gammaproteobacteria bacterium]|jgi:MSHA biogenesis protein MshG